jgi:glutamate carboxypeptidase
MDARHEGWSILQSICDRLDVPFAKGAAGGGSDGSRLAAVGVRVLDGLGSPGGGEHADDEHINCSRLRESFMRNTTLIAELARWEAETS